MRRVTRTVGTLALLSWMTAFAPAPARACSCMATTVEDAIASSSAIFEARVERVEPDGAVLVVTLAVTQAWAGVEGEHVTVRTRGDSAACGFPFEEGGRYLVFATGESEQLAVSLCSHTARIEDAAADRGALGAGVIPVDVVDESIESVRPPRTEPPARGGCASCAASRGTMHPAFSLTLALWLLSRLRKNRP